MMVNKPQVELREKNPNTEFLLVRIFLFQYKYGKIRTRKKLRNCTVSRSVGLSIF